MKYTSNEMKNPLQFKNKITNAPNHPSEYNSNETRHFEIQKQIQYELMIIL